MLQAVKLTFPPALMASRRLAVIFGAELFGNPREGNVFNNDATILEAISILQRYGVRKLDTAQLYGESEATLGRLKIGTEYGMTIDTKWLGGWAGEAWASEERIVTAASESLERLGLRSGQVDVFYVHSPDMKTPIEGTLRGVDKAFRSGAFRRFGLSNYTPAQVREVIEIAKENGFVRPSVYQGSYSVVGRSAEDGLIPLLRQKGIAFYAYAPLASGLLVSSKASSRILSSIHI